MRNEEILLGIERMMEQIELEDFGVEDAQIFIRNNPILLHYFLSKKGYSTNDIQNFYENDLMVTNIAPPIKDYKKFFEATSKSYKKGTKKLFVVLNKLNGLTKMTKRGVVLLHISFYELLETSINGFRGKA